MVPYKKILTLLLPLSFFFAWFDGLSFGIGFRNVTISATASFVFVLIWLPFVLYKGCLSLRRGDQVYTLYIIAIVTTIALSILLNGTGLDTLGRYSTIISYLAFTFAFFDTVSSDKTLNLISKFIIYAVIVASIYVVYIYFTSNNYSDRMYGLISTDNPNYAANRLLVGVLFSLIVAINSGDSLAWSAFFLGSVALILAGSGGAMFALILTTILYIFVNLKSLKNTLLGLVAIALLGSAVAYEGTIPNRLIGGIEQVRGHEVTGPASSIAIRMQLDSIAILMFQNNPISGIGFGRWRNEAPYYGTDLVSHNSHLLAAAEMGILSLSFYLFYAYIISAKPISTISIAAKWGFIGCLIHMAALGGYTPKVAFLMSLIVIKSISLNEK